MWHTHQSWPEVVCPAKYWLIGPLGVELARNQTHPHSTPWSDLSARLQWSLLRPMAGLAAPAKWSQACDCLESWIVWQRQCFLYTLKRHAHSALKEGDYCWSNANPIMSTRFCPDETILSMWSFWGLNSKPTMLQRQLGENCKCLTNQMCREPGSRRLTGSLKVSNRWPVGETMMPSYRPAAKMTLGILPHCIGIAWRVGTTSCWCKAPSSLIQEALKLCCNSEKSSQKPLSKAGQTWEFFGCAITGMQYQSSLLRIRLRCSAANRVWSRTLNIYHLSLIQGLWFHDQTDWALFLNISTDNAGHVCWYPYGQWKTYFWLWACLPLSFTMAVEGGHLSKGVQVHC